MKNFINNHIYKVLSVLMVLVMSVTILTTGFQAGAFAHRMNQKGTVSYSQFFTGYAAQKNYFGSGSAEKITIKSRGSERRAFCAKPGYGISTAKNAYKITKQYDSRFIKAAINYYYDKVKSYSGDRYNYELYLTQVVIWRTIQWGNNHPGKHPAPSDLLYKNKIVTIAKGSPLAKKVSGAESKAKDAFRYMITNVDSHKSNVEAFKWTRDDCQSFVTGRQLSDLPDEKCYVTLKGKKHGTDSDTDLSGCTIKFYKGDGTTQLKDKDGKYISATTDANGNYSTSNQPFDFKDYKNNDIVVKETSANSGTIINKGSFWVKNSNWKAKVDEDDETNTVDLSSVSNEFIENKPVTKNLVITKYDENNSPLSGATITLYQYAGGSNYPQVKSVTTGSDGKANFGTLKNTKTNKGIYIARETSGPDGYTINNETIVVHVNTSSPATITNTIKDQKAKDGSLYIYKYDKDTRETLSGAEFTLYEYTNTGAEKKITTIPETKTGCFEVQGLEIKKDYLVKETKTPKGYKESNYSTKFRLEKNGQAKELKVDNESFKRKIELLKVSSETDEGLVNATYSLYKGSVKDENLLATKITDKDGKIDFGELKSYQKYILKEVVAPKGYEKNPKEYVVEPSIETEKITVKVKDDPIKRPIRIHKISGSHTGKASKELGGAFFKIYDVTGKDEITVNNYQSYDYSNLTPVAEKTTDEHGYFETDRLPIGRYVVVETKAPKNYLLAPPEMVEITDETIDYAEVEIIDNEFEAYVRVTKTDKTTGKVVKVAGAGFKLYDVTNGKYVKANVAVQDEENVVEVESESIESTFYTNEEGVLDIGKLLPVGEYRLEEVEAPKGYNLSDKKINFTIDDEANNFVVTEGEDVYVDLTYEDEAQLGSFEITKLGQHVKSFDEKSGFTYEDNTYLKGAEFNIYAKEDIKAPYDNELTLIKAGDLVKTITTDKNGKAKADDLYLGSYTYKETKSPNGYYNEKKSGEFTLTYDKNKEVVESKADVTNTRQKVKITIYKKDKETEKLLEGAVFGIYAKEDIKDTDGEVIVKKDALIEKCTSDSNGQVTVGEELNYPVNEFYIKELKAPKGYATNHDIFDIDLSNSVTTVDTINKEYVIYDEITKFDFSKHDITNKEEIEGASLTLTYKNEDGEEVVVDSWVSTKKEHRIQGLEVDKTYTLTEKLPPAGYVTAESIEFVVKDTGEVQTVKMYDDVTKAKFSKVDKDTKELLEGAKLTITDENGEEFKTFTTTSKEASYFEKIPIGKYTLKEVETPNGYVTAPNLPFEIEDTSNVQEFTMEDAKTIVEISKVNETGTKQLSGATLKLTNKDTGKVVKEWVTNGKVATFEKLPVGEYVLTETKAPTGYAIADDIKFNVGDVEKNVKVIMYDKKVTGTVTLVKAASDTKEALENATYTVYDKNMNEIDTLTTDSEGKAEVTGLALKKDNTVFYVKETDAPSGYSVSNNTYKAVFKKQKDGKSVIKVKLGRVYDAPKTTIIPQTGVFTDNMPLVIILTCGGLLILFIILDRLDKRKRKKIKLS